MVDYIENVSANSTLTIIEGSNPLSVEIPKELSDLVVFPNPASEKITIKSDTKINKLILYNNLGIEILKAYPSSTIYSVNLFNLSSGLYCLKVYQYENEIIKKIIKK